MRTHIVARDGVALLGLVAVLMLRAPIASAAQLANDSFGDYAQHGDERAQQMVTTYDRHTAVTAQTMQAPTHDVTIVKIMAPNTGKVKRNRTISVGIVSKRAAESVRIELYKSDPGAYDGFQLIGYRELLAPARSSNRTVMVNFSYTFTRGDASVGKVTFKAVATIVGGRDALPADNEARATTKVGISHLQWLV